MSVLATAAQLRRADWMVETIDLAQARELVGRLHYSGGGSNTATFRHGLFRRDKWPLYVSGAAWWIPPTRTAAEASTDGDWRRVLTLSRFVLDPVVPKNGASFLLSRSVRLIRRSGAWDVLVTYADEWQGHLGTMYLASGWEYVGKTKPERVYVLNGRMVARKAGPRTRTHAEMVAMGAECVGAFSKHKFRLALAALPSAEQTNERRTGAEQSYQDPDELAYLTRKPRRAVSSEATGVRRLTPRECERLQALPDDWTAFGPDSRRYAALGDAVTASVSEWIGRRMMAVAACGNAVVPQRGELAVRLLSEAS